MSGTAATPATEHPFKVNHSPKFLDNNKKQYFHTMNSKLILLQKGARPDILEVVSIFTTILNGLYMNCHKKASIFIKYLSG